MSQGYSCKCPEKNRPLGNRRWGVIQRNCNHSAFNGYRETYSDYSSVVCLGCGMVWRTKARFVGALPNVQIGQSNRGHWEYQSPQPGREPIQGCAVKEKGEL